MPPTPLPRREFLKQIAGGTLAVSLGLAAPAATRRFRVAVIGATGQGNYGHKLDLVFAGIPGIEIVAVADPDAAGRAMSKERLKAPHGYADFRAMLEKEPVDIVVVATRWSALHHARIKAALEAGAHVISEKPFTLTLAEADELLMLAARNNLKICVAHQARLAPSILRLKQSVDQGLIGELEQIRMFGKQDKRAGGEDMLVLGVHEFQLARFFAGDPLWCTARIRQSGHEATLADVRPASEGDGPILGDEVEAMLAFPKGVNATYTSRGKLAKTEPYFSMELIGTERSVRYEMGFDPQVLIKKPSGKSREEVWRPLAGDGFSEASNHDQALGNRRLAEDMLSAIELNREPACSGRSAMQALEAVHAIFAAGLSGRRMAFPLANRRHPLIA